MSESEIRRAIELLSRHGYQVWKDGAKIVTEADRERERQSREWSAAIGRLINRPDPPPDGVWGGPIMDLPASYFTPDGRYLLPRRMRP